MSRTPDFLDDLIAQSGPDFAAKVEAALAARVAARAHPDMLADVREFMELAQPERLTRKVTPPDVKKARDLLLELARDAHDTATLLKPHFSASALGARLMIEELAETLAAMANADMVGFADGLADLVYVVLWTAHAHGIPFHAVWSEVQRANLSKFPTCPTCSGSGKETLKLSAAASFFNGNNEDAEVKCEKCGGVGHTIYRDAGGKVTKPPGWTPPDVGGVLDRYLAGEK